MSGSMNFKTGKDAKYSFGPSGKSCSLYLKQIKFERVDSIAPLQLLTLSALQKHSKCYFIYEKSLVGKYVNVVPVSRKPTL
jgi:hypothetical protein